jgi:arsenate reductase
VITLPVWRRALGELVGTALLTTAIVGSGFAARMLSPHDAGLQLAESAAATGLALYVAIRVLAPVSGAHLNPLVTLIDVIVGRRGARDALAYLPAQVAGGILGTLAANAMFAHPLVSVSGIERLNGPHLLSEAIATAGLILAIFGLARARRSRLVAGVVAAYIAAAYFFTSSTSFANPAVTIARVFTDGTAGVAPGAALGFVLAQIVGAAAGSVLIRVLFGRAAGSLPTAAD